MPKPTEKKFCYPTDRNSLILHNTALAIRPESNNKVGTKNFYLTFCSPACNNCLSLQHTTHIRELYKRLVGENAQITKIKFIINTYYTQYTWCGYKITGLMLEHLSFKKLHNRNVVTLNVLPSAIPTPLHVNLPRLEAMLQVVF